VRCTNPNLESRALWNGDCPRTPTASRSSPLTASTLVATVDALRLRNNRGLLGSRGHCCGIRGSRYDGAKREEQKRRVAKEQSYQQAMTIGHAATKSIEIGRVRVTGNMGSNCGVCGGYV
jgi:hypothetical protein